MAVWNSARLTLPDTNSIDGSTSLVAAEIHLGRRPAGICGRLAALQHSNAVPDRFV
jgi:hypothetical protein